MLGSKLNIVVCLALLITDIEIFGLADLEEFEVDAQSPSDFLKLLQNCSSAGNYYFGDSMQCSCLHERNSCSINSICQADCQSNCADLFTVRNKKCYSELACSTPGGEENVNGSKRTTEKTTKRTTTKRTTSKLPLKQNLSCGSHRGVSCANCPRMFRKCNGNCKWNYLRKLCQNKPIKTTSLTDVGLVMSGGYVTGWSVDSGWSRDNTVEVYVPSTGNSCYLPPLGEGRYYHTMQALHICGGYSTRSTCLQFQAGTWVPSHHLTQDRYRHSSCVLGDRELIMGGEGSNTTTELLVSSTQYKSTQQYSLKYPTQDVCSISDSHFRSVYVTGGYYTKNIVSQYSMQGRWMRDLPELLEGRRNHGCGAYLTKDGVQVLLVAGGFDWYYGADLSSTELYYEGTRHWVSTQPLPMAMSRVGSSSVGNTIYLSGGRDGNKAATDMILEWREGTNQWVEVARMRRHRAYHAMSSVVLTSEILQYCV